MRFADDVARLLMIVVLLLASPFARATEADWKLEKDADGIQIYTRAVDGWQIREMRGVTRVDARLASVVAVIHDVSALHELSDVVASSEIRKHESDTRYQVYSMMKMPWPVSNRDILNQRSIAQDPTTLVVTIVDTATEDQLPLKNDYVRILKSRQQWTLTPQAGGGVAVETRTLSDPNGPIPAALINSMAVSTPFKTLSKLKQMAQRPAYAQATLAFIKEPPAKP
jgi:hypothetical protein